MNIRAGSVPNDFAWAFAPSMNSAVATPTVGMPRASSSAMSCVQHDMQDPQSLSPSITRLTSVAICCCNGSGAVRVLVGFMYRLTASPCSRSRSSRRSRNTSPRALAMSRSPIVSPSSRSGRGSRARWLGLRSEVGSRSTLMISPPSFATPRSNFAFPAKAGIHSPTAPSPEAWIPAFAGNAIFLETAISTYALVLHLSCHGHTPPGARGPAADNAGKHPGTTAGPDDHKPARTEFVDTLSGKRGRAAFGDALGAGDQLLAGDLAQPVELLIEPRLRPAGIPEGALMLGADDQERIAGRRKLDAEHRLQRLGHAARQALRRARFLVDDALQPEAGKNRDCRHPLLHPALDRERFPARALLVLGEAIAELAGVAEGGAVDLLRPAFADIADHQLQRAADRGVGTIALAQRVALGVHPDAAAHRAVDHDDRPGEHRRRQHPVHRKALVEHRFDRRQHDRQVFRLAPRHHHVDRDLLDLRPSERRRHQPDDLLRVARGAVEHAQDALLGRRHQRQPVRPAAREHRLLLVLVLADLDAARFEPGLVETHFEALDGARLDVLRAAARASFGQAASEPGEPGKPLPL